MLDPLSIVTGGAAGSIITLVWTHCRARADRKRTFLSFLAAKKQEVLSERYRATPSQFIPRYPEIQIEFRQQSTLIHADIPKRARLRFQQLIDDIVGLPGDIAGTPPGLERICKTIGETEDFINAA